MGPGGKQLLPEKLLTILLPPRMIRQSDGRLENASSSAFAIPEKNSPFMPTTWIRGPISTVP